MTDNTPTTDINIRESAQRVVALLEQNRAREAFALLERERTGERVAVQEALDRYVAADGAQALATLRTNGVPAELTAVADRLARASGAPRHPVVEDPGTDELRGLTDAQRYDIYASIVQTHGSQAARDALSNGDRVILGLRQENSTLAAASRVTPGQRQADDPATPRDESRGGTGIYDDRLVVLWRDASGNNGHVYEALHANTEPTAQYDHHAGSNGRRPYSDGGSDRQVRAASAGYEDVARARKIEGDDVNNDGLRDLGRLATGTYEMQRATHPWGGRASFALRPTEDATRDGHNRVERDTNADGYFTAADVNGRQPLNNSFKIHFGSTGNTDSAGCQTIHPDYAPGFERAARENPQQTRWQYVLAPTTPGLWRDVQTGIELAPAERPAAPRAAPAPAPAPAPPAGGQPPQHHGGAQGQPLRRDDPGQVFPAGHADRALFNAIHSHLPEGTSQAQAAHVMAQAKQNGIRDTHQLDRIAVVDGNAWVVGRTPGFLARVDLSAPTPPLAESLRQSEQVDQQQAMERQQVAMSAPGMGGRGMA